MMKLRGSRRRRRRRPTCPRVHAKRHADAAQIDHVIHTSVAAAAAGNGGNACVHAYARASMSCPVLVAVVERLRLPPGSIARASVHWDTTQCRFFLFDTSLKHPRRRTADQRFPIARWI